jgi:hypothetical protein
MYNGLLGNYGPDAPEVPFGEPTLRGMRMRGIDKSPARLMTLLPSCDHCMSHGSLYFTVEAIGGALDDNPIFHRVIVEGPKAAGNSLYLVI